MGHLNQSLRHGQNRLVVPRSFGHVVGVDDYLAVLGGVPQAGDLPINGGNKGVLGSRRAALDRLSLGEREVGYLTPSSPQFFDQPVFRDGERDALVGGTNLRPSEHRVNPVWLHAGNHIASAPSGPILFLWSSIRSIHKSLFLG